MRHKTSDHWANEDRWRKVLSLIGVGGSQKQKVTAARSGTFLFYLTYREYQRKDARRRMEKKYGLASGLT